MPASPKRQFQQGQSHGPTSENVHLSGVPSMECLNELQFCLHACIDMCTTNAIEKSDSLLTFRRSAGLASEIAGLGLRPLSSRLHSLKALLPSSLCEGNESHASQSRAVQLLALYDCEAFSVHQQAGVFKMPSDAFILFCSLPAHAPLFRPSTLRIYVLQAPHRFYACCHLVCYSWWCMSCLSILGRLHWIDQKALTDFILGCQWNSAVALRLLKSSLAMENCWVNKEQDRHPGTHLHFVHACGSLKFSAALRMSCFCTPSNGIHPRLCKRKKKEEPRRQ
eukprot:1149880-Pelagomonas_calceolata.AAC.1